MEQFLCSLDPDPDCLLKAISSHTTDEALDWISTADYGSRADEHLVALKQVRDTCTFPVDMAWCPAEVMELIRWSEPEDPNWKPGCMGEFGHWMRAFSCAALLRATRTPYNYGDGIGTDSTLVQLVLSLRVLPIDFSLPARQFLAWLLLQIDLEGEDEQVCSYSVGLFWLVVQNTGLSHSDSVLVEFAKWISCRTGLLFGRYSEDCIGGLQQMVSESLKRESWRKLGNAFIELDLAGRLDTLQVWTKTIGKQLIA